MANVTKLKRDEMIKFLEELKNTHTDDSSIRAFNEIENALTEKKFGLVFEEHTEEVDEKLLNEIPVFCADESRKICKNKNLPYNFIIEGDNLQALYLLEKTHRGRIDCIYIDPPYNTGAKDWKYNNDYVDGTDNYRHSKWLSMMKTRLLIAKKLLNPKDSTLICTIDEKEYAHLGCLLEELFPTATIQMISCMINPATVARKNQFGRTDEYIYYVFIGESGPQKLPLSDDWMSGVKNSTRHGHHWNPLMRTGSGNMRKDAPNCFYPIFVTDDGKHFCSVGESLPLGVDRNTVDVPDGQIAIWPIHLDGSEGRWRYSRSGLIEIQKGGYVKLGGLTPRGMALSYLAEGERKKIESGEYKVVGKREDGSLIIDDEGYVAKYIPGTQWTISNHDASRNGTNLIQKMLGAGRFTFPKSLYSTLDTINFVVANKPNAIVLDFFAGSGTTQHAVNLLNKIDGGNRTCIMVTNNELSQEEETRLKKQGYKKGDEEWENLGIAKYVTWPRTYCSINGCDVNGKELKGEYLINDLNDNPITLADGFISNVKYYKCDWIPRKPEDYLLSNILCLHIKEMIEIENAIEVDNIENVIIFNRDDYNNYISNDDNYKLIKRLWVNQNIIFDSDELKKLNNKGFKYIPKEYFGQELKEAAE